MFMSNGLRHLNLFLDCKQSNLINIVHLILEWLSYFQLIELHCTDYPIIEMIYTLICRLWKLNFLTIRGEYTCTKLYDKKFRDLHKSTTPFQKEAHNTTNTCIIHDFAQWLKPIFEKFLQSRL
jgi:hypothetical protein